mgnify:CR=1 FL=1
MLDDDIRMTATHDVTISIQGQLGTITLNRPKALNALTTDMAASIHKALDWWAQEPSVKGVVIEGAEDRAFCAGGDVRALYEDGKDQYMRADADLAAAKRFFGTEYAMNRRIHTFPKPYIALVDGVSMGGGFGLSQHGSHRVVTERTIFAMPETGIGLFPDVGATYVLPRLPSEMGTYLGLTGSRIGAADMIWLGLGTHYVPAARVDDLKQALFQADFLDDAFAVADSIIDRFRQQPESPTLVNHEPLIQDCFGRDSVARIIAALDTHENDGFAKETAATLAKMSPSSLKVSLMALRSAPADFDACMQREFAIAMSCMRHHDFYEGIRAVLVDKDRNPHWEPATLDAVPDALIEKYVEPKDPPLAFN